LLAPLGFSSTTVVDLQVLCLMLILYRHVPQCPSHPVSTPELQRGLLARRVGRSLLMTGAYISSVWLPR